MDVQFDILGAQVINFLIIFFLFKKFLGDSLIKTIEERRMLIKKLKNADHEYEKAINDAKYQADKIIHKANTKADDILKNKELIAKQEYDNTLKKAQEKAVYIINEAEQDSKKIERTLLEHRTNNIKKTTQLVVKKLIGKDTQLQDQYLDTIIRDLEK